MIEIYNKDNLNFEANGDITLEPVSCIYKSELNEIKEITLEHHLDELGRWKYIKEDSLICVSNNGKKQFYRIYNKVKNLDSIIAYAQPLFYDLIDNVLLDVRPTNCTGQEALDTILKGTKFKGHSNISKVNTSYYVRKNIIEAITSNDENSFFNRWGGEIYLDNYDIYINNKVGTDRGVRIEFGYNLEAVEEEININEVATRIIPTGYDGIMLSGSTPWVDSPNINKYVNIKTRVVNFDDVKVKENPEDEEGFNTLVEAQQELIRRCKLLYEGGIDKPTINYKIDMVGLSDTTVYKDFKDLEEISEGDTVTCHVKHLDIDVQARCIALERDEITGKILNIELGNFISNYFEQQIDITSRVDSILSDLDNRFNNVITPGGAIRAEKIQGFINGTKAKLKASRDIAQTQEQRVIDFEDLDPNSPTYGSTILGTQGIFVADSKNTSDEWDYTAALTARGLVANLLYGKILAGTGAYFDIEKGEIYFNKGFIQGSNSSWNLATGEIQSTLPDGSKIIISPTSGFYNQFGTSKREYHHLNYSKNASVEFSNSEGSKTVTITLPSEFKNKNFQVIPGISDVFSRLFPNCISNFGIYVTNINKANATFDLKISCKALALNYVANSSNGYKVIDDTTNFNIVIDYNFSVIA